MKPIENKLESIALKRALTLKTERNWNTQNQKNIKKIDWLLKGIIKRNPNINADKIVPYSILDKNYNIRIDDRNDITIK